MTPLTAIDMLIQPESAALERASAENQQLLVQYPAGFALDEKHKPHITLLQRYVRTEQLDAVFAAVQAVMKSHDLTKLGFRAKGVRHMPVAAIPGHGLAAIVVTPAPEVLDLQSALIGAVSPFIGTGGTGDAFVTTTEEPQINQDTLNYVENYVPDHSGANFVAHLTVGLAPLDYLAKIESEPFDEFTFHPAQLAVFQLGNNGTASKLLKEIS